MIPLDIPSYLSPHSETKQFFLFHFIYIHVKCILRYEIPIRYKSPMVKYLHFGCFNNWKYVCLIILRQCEQPWKSIMHLSDQNYCACIITIVIISEVIYISYSRMSSPAPASRRAAWRRVRLPPVLSFHSRRTTPRAFW